MAKTIGIIPVGGTATRFHGLEKELLPISEKECALSRCIRSMQRGGADSVALVTNHKRAVTLSEFTKGAGSLCIRESVGLWDVFIAAEKLKADWYYFAMPDTVFPDDVFMIEKIHPVMVGTFLTDKPERFGMMREGQIGMIQECQIVDKQRGAPGRAWGVLILDGRSMTYLAEQAGKTHDHTAALNALLSNGFVEFPLEYYYDLATFNDYVEYLCGLT